MAQVNKTQLKSYFETGDKPNSSNWGELINSSLNLEESASITTQIFTLTGGGDYTGSLTGSSSPFTHIQSLKGPLCLADSSSNSTDRDFFQVTPSFVPNLQPHIKVFSFDTSTAMHSASIGNIGTNTFIWERDTDNSSLLIASCSISNSVGLGTGKRRDNFPYGSFVLKTGGTEGHQTALATSVTPFTCRTGSKWWVKTRFSLADHDGTEFFFGLTEEAADKGHFHTGSYAAGKDRVAIVKRVHNGDDVTYGVSQNATPNPPLSSSVAFTNITQTYDKDFSIVSYGIFWDGVSNIKFYGNKVASSSIPGPMKLLETYSGSAIPSSSNMRLALMIETGVGAPAIAEVEYLQGAIQTPRG
tara:strand:- start:3103 stop:4176 length:1074 start_codon:yes stop_codon:yes gene_type:complete